MNLEMNDRPINPMAFKIIRLGDTIPPVVLGLYYKLIHENSINGSNSGFNEQKLKKFQIIYLFQIH